MWCVEKSANDIRAKMLSAEDPDALTELMNGWAKDVLATLLHYDPAKRLTAEQFVQRFDISSSATVSDMNPEAMVTQRNAEMTVASKRRRR